ncbi:MAG TPA: helix-turn-helix domain-containing protein [Mycobacteriales bacterium]
MKSAVSVDEALPVRAEGTRERVLRLLLSEGPATAAALAARLGLTTAGVRRHLDAMVADGTLVGTEPRGRRSRGRGRPARVYALTDGGHARAQHAYDALAVDALAFLDGLGSLEDFAAARADDLRVRYAREVPRGGTAALAQALTSDGYAATVHEVPTGAQICQHHCPVAGVAARFPQLCEAETAAFSVLLGQHVQRLATIAHGDGVCTTHIPAVPGGASIPAVPGGSTARTTASRRGQA